MHVTYLRYLLSLILHNRNNRIPSTTIISFEGRIPNTIWPTPIIILFTGPERKFYVHLRAVTQPAISFNKSSL